MGNFFKFFLPTFFLASLMCLEIKPNDPTNAVIVRENTPIQEPYFNPTLVEGLLNGHIQLGSGIKLHFVEAGDPKKPLVFFVHGFPEFWYAWRYQLHEFKSKYHVVAIDMRGYNLSQKPKGASEYSIVKLANDIVEAIQAFKNDKIQNNKHSAVTLVAHDWGAALSWVAVKNEPDLVEKLVIMDAPNPDALKDPGVLSLKKIVTNSYLYTVMRFQIPWYGEHFIKANDFQWLQKMYHDDKESAFVHKERFAEIHEPWKRALSEPGAITSLLNYFRSPVYGFLSDLPGKVKSAASNLIKSKNNTVKPTSVTPKSIKPKTLLIWGKHDVTFGLDMAEASVKHCVDAQLVVIDDASHWVQQDTPEKVNKLIDEFLNGKEVETEP